MNTGDDQIKTCSGHGKRPSPRNLNDLNGIIRLTYCGTVVREYNASNRDFSLPRCRPESIPSPIIPVCVCDVRVLSMASSVLVLQVGSHQHTQAAAHHQTLNVRDALLQYTY